MRKRERNIKSVNGKDEWMQYKSFENNKQWN